MTARDKVFAWMTGWKTGAAFLPIPDEYQHGRCGAEAEAIFSAGVTKGEG